MLQTSLHSLKKAGFTLVELIIALSISALVLIIIFYFVTDTVIQLAETNKNSKFLGDFSRFTAQMNAHMSTFPDASIFINEVGLGHDVILLESPESTSAILWGVVDAETLKLIPSGAPIGTYQNTVMGYRLVSPTELVAISGTPSLVYDLDFFGDKLFYDFKVKEFQAEYYNANEIISIDLGIVTTFEEELVGVSWDSLPKDNIFQVNLNF